MSNQSIKGIVSFNINSYVYVKLTPLGEAHLDRKRGNIAKKFFRIQLDNGYTKWQLHELMSVFGDAIIEGCDLVFETQIYFNINDIEVLDTLP